MSVPKPEPLAATSAGMTPEEGARLLDGAAAADQGDTAQMLVVKLWHLVSHGLHDAAAAFSGTLPPPGAGGDALWARELANIRARLPEHAGQACGRRRSAPPNRTSR